LNAALLAAPLVAGSTVVAFADCVSGLANCAIECDQRIKPDDPYRPQCAQACVSIISAVRALKSFGRAPAVAF
jgi:hypothetical protein